MDIDESEYETRRRILAQFRQFDQDGSRVIDKSELAALLGTLEPNTWTATATSRLMKGLDVNQDGVIDFEEFLNWAFSSEGDAVLKQAWVDSGWRNHEKQFDKWDHDGDGLIDLEKFAQCLQRLDATTWTPAVTQSLVSNLDKDHNGTIDFDEFMSWVGFGGSDADLSGLMCGGKAARAPANEVLTPVRIEPPGGTHVDFVFVEMRTLARGAKIYYTIDGSEPTCDPYRGPQGTSMLYCRPVAIDGHCGGDKVILKARAVLDEEETPVTTHRFHITLPRVNVEIKAGKRHWKRGTEDPAQLIFSTLSPNADIYYTLDGTEPDQRTEDLRRFPADNALLYKAPVDVAKGPIYIKAIATKTIDNRCTMWSLSTTYKMQQPLKRIVVSPVGGQYMEPLYISIGDLGDDVTIRYTTDGAEPTEKSKAYGSPIILKEGEVVFKASAFRGEEVLKSQPQEYSVTQLVGTLPKFVVNGTLKVGQRAARVLKESTVSVSSALRSALTLESDEQTSVLPDAKLETDDTVRLEFVVRANTTRAEAQLQHEGFIDKLVEVLRDEEFIRVSASDIALANVASKPLTEVKLRLRWQFRKKGVPDYLDSAVIAYRGLERLGFVDTSKYHTRWKVHDRVRLRNFPPNETLAGAVGEIEEKHGPHRCRVALDKRQEGLTRPRGGFPDVELHLRALAREDGKEKHAHDSCCDDMVVHGGDVMESDRGCHEIKVSLTRPDNVPSSAEPTDPNDLYVVLSPCHSDNLGKYRAPVLEIVDIERPEHVILSHTFSCRRDNAASLVLARLSRRAGSRPWELVALGKPCNSRLCDAATGDCGKVGTSVNRWQQRVTKGREVRMPLARLKALYDLKRARLRTRAAAAFSAAEDNDQASFVTIVGRVFDLPEALFRRVVNLI